MSCVLGALVKQLSSQLSSLLPPAEETQRDALFSRECFFRQFYKTRHRRLESFTSQYNESEIVRQIICYLVLACVLSHTEPTLSMCFRLKWRKETGSDTCISYLSGCLGNEWEPEFLNMANIGGPIHLQESGPTGYPLQPRSTLGILVSSQVSASE